MLWFALTICASLLAGIGVLAGAAWRRRHEPRTLDGVLGRDLLLTARDATSAS